jgi:D-alanyl-D-alanine carboxypeptidase/D-alanyl-D-alanine-endopeptidase (penicillin-binding protein 4)
MLETRSRVAVVLLSAALMFGCTVPGYAQPLNAQARQIIGGVDLKGADVSAYAVDLSTGAELISIDADEPMAPASNLKVITTAAALKILGPDFRFRTELRVADGPNGSTIIVHGDGDPSFADPKILKASGMDVEQLLQLMVSAVQKAKVTKIDRVVVDDRIFEASGVHPCWKSKDLGDWFTAPVAGFNFFDNCLDFYPAVVNGRVEVRTSPATPFMKITNKVQYYNHAKDSFSAVHRAGVNEWTCAGVIEATHTSPTSAPVADAPEFFADVLADRLSAAGIPVGSSSKAAPAEKLPESRVILPIETPIGVVMQRCNKDSINLFAEAFCKRVGFKATGQQGSWENGTAAVLAFIRQTVGEKAVAHVTISDGSGLCKENRVTTRILVGVLQAMNNDAKLAKTFRDSLSVGGEDGDGTLKKAGRFKNINGQVYAKTGYIAGASTLSGYLVEPGANGGPGRVVAYSVLCFNPKGGVVPGDCKAVQDRIVGLIDKSVASEPAASQKTALPTSHRTAAAK